jgi:DnaJ family protein C protein 9
MGLLCDCKQYFGSDDLYVILGVNKDSNETQIKSAYRKLSLKVHPDRAEDERKEVAKRAFQTLSKIHYILSDKSLRETYDETGLIPDDDSFESSADWDQYWRLLFPKITVKDIDTFLHKYIGSEDEKKDLKNIYIRFNGDMDLISQTHIAFDEDRTRQLLLQMIRDKEVPQFDAFLNESTLKRQKRAKKLAKEAKLAEKEGNKCKVTAEEDLVLSIQSRAKSNFNELIADLEAKYANSPKKAKTQNKNSKRK